jgi:kynurenine formamidase
VIEVAVSIAQAALLEVVTTARVYDLEQPRRFGAPTFPPHAPGYQYVLHRRHEWGVNDTRTSASGLVIMSDHSGTHIDAPCHQAERLQLFDGHQVDAELQTPTGFRALGADTIPPILARGVLLDVAAHAGERIPAHHPVSAAQLQTVAAAQAVSVGRGDIVLVRTGNGAFWDDPAEYERGGGVARDASEWLADQDVLAVGADNLAWDDTGLTDPELGTLPGHLMLLVRSGIYILENLYLEDLSHGRVYEFVVACLPLKMTGATGSPVRPVAIVAQAGAVQGHSANPTEEENSR